MPRMHIQTMNLPRRTGIFARVTHFLQQSAARRRDRLKLGHLDQRLLRDIGLDPDQFRDPLADRNPSGVPERQFPKAFFALTPELGRVFPALLFCAAQSKRPADWAGLRGKVRCSAPYESG